MMPRGIPINIQNKTAVKIIASVVMLSDQRSTRSIKSKLKNEKIANLIPVVMLFGVGLTPGVVATIIFALPPIIRLTNLGIRQVGKGFKEAGSSLGLT